MNIYKELKETYNVSEEEIGKDVEKIINDLVEKNLIENISDEK